ncbi:chemoreceptor [Pantoea ananatis]|uniref:methyl-accepting chemotaxis protein n=1 Tax=Pantoea TaxID=53335 RepID=UPI0006A1A16F|nr:MULTISPECIES: methyl-accepting chemotaxis protein [Pantoea]AVG77371.1 chemoreceptor [Pantoea ananatis]KNA28164.1 chemoreceptor [Pantoea ananatis]MCS3402225.1 methyl-accepting chemotaxis protein [Pantoea sp. B566]
MGRMMSPLTLLSRHVLKRRSRFRFPAIPTWLTSLRGNFILFVVLFCLLQSIGIVLLTAQVSQNKVNLTQASAMRDRLALLDRARVELLTASDNSHRAGLYLMEDQKSGSVDSWKSLAETAKSSLLHAEQLFARYHAAPGGELQQGFTLLKQGLEEQLKGLEGNNIDAFFMVPMQAYQQQFNSAWFNEITQTNKQLTAVNSLTLQTLMESRNLALMVTGLLFVLLLTGGVLLLRGVIVPLRLASRQLQDIATGDLINCPVPPRLQSLETSRLFNAVAEMRQGLRTIVAEINTIAASVAEGTREMQHTNEQVSEQYQAQNSSFSHISQRLHRVSEEVENSTLFSQQASEQAHFADDLMQQCTLQVDEMEVQMRHIVASSGEIAGIVEMLDGLSLQTRLLALNAAIESAHAGVYGRSFGVVAKEMGNLSNKSGESAQQINGLVNHTQLHISEGFNKVKSLEALFNQISQSVSAVVTQLQELQENATAQSRRVTGIAAEVVALDKQLQTNESLTARQGRTVDTLQQQAARLAESVQQFRITL